MIIYVNPYIGNVSHLLVPTFPCVQLPNSLLRVYPKRADYTSEYLGGFPVIVTSHREVSPFTLYFTQDGPADKGDTAKGLVQQGGKRPPPPGTGVI